eukprot:COSAG01_NODE_7676_length_3103_cov_1.446072_5_plen_42_part_00
MVVHECNGVSTQDDQEELIASVLGLAWHTHAGVAAGQIPVL